jgi:DNA-binding response OmpR family regulator
MAKKILVIEDSPTALSLITTILENEGYKTIGAKTGQEGVEKVVLEKPDLIIIDTLLPDVDGFEVCRQIRQNQATEFPKIIIMTGVVDAIDAVKARKSGADDYCVKTQDLSCLIECVKRQI